MKIKKLAALALTCAIVATGASFAACGDGNTDDGKKPGTEYVEDTRIWYAVGKDSKGTLKDQGWNENNSQYAFTKDTTVTNENVFTLSLDIYAGNVGTGLSFKFLYKETADEANVPWERQVGMQHLEGKEGSDADTVLKIDGKTVFTTANDNGAYNNIALAKGQEGRYKFTLKTKSNTDNNPVITVTKESPITVNYDMYVIGDMNNFGASGKVELTENPGAEGAATTWTAKLDVTKAALYRDAEGALAEDDDGNANGTHAAICLLNNRDGKTFVPAAGDGVIIKEVKSFANKSYTCLLVPEGKYNIVFTEAKTDTEVGGTVTVTESAFEMYIIGTVNNWNVATACTPDYALQEQKDGSWTTTITVDKDEKIKTYNKKGLTDSDRYSAGADVTLTAGTWAIKYDPETNTFKAEKVGYHMVGRYGDMTDTTGWQMGLAAGKAVALEDKGEGVYSADVELTTADAFKVVSGTVICGPINWYDLGSGDITVTENGTYTITATVSGESVTITVVKKA